METVHILRDVNSIQNRLFVHVLRKRQLHEDAVHILVRVIFANYLQYLIFRHICIKFCAKRDDAHLLACALFGPNIRLRIFALPDEDNRQTWCLQPRAETFKL